MSQYLTDDVHASRATMSFELTVYTFISCRAAFLCGREPNFDITTKEQEELSKLTWEEFLNMTRMAIHNKSNYFFP